MNGHVGSVERLVTVGEGACAAQIGRASASPIRRTRTGAQRSVLVLAAPALYGATRAGTGHEIS